MIQPVPFVNFRANGRVTIVPKVGNPLAGKGVLPAMPVTAWIAVGYMLENPCIPSLRAGPLLQQRRNFRAVNVRDNAAGAENQQERLWHCGWIAGFVDGEGCFSCPIFRNRTTALGWQVQPEFVVVQSVQSRQVLEELAHFFDCGHVTDQRRHDDHRSDLSRFRVTRISDLRDVIVPFFQANRLRTSKQHDFEKFVHIVDLMQLGKHRTLTGIEEIASVAETMNRRKPSTALRILRDHTPTISSHPG
jgi:LAGLIDADG endonuclease